MKRFLGFLKQYRVQAILGPLFKMLEAMFDLFVPLVMASIINVGIAGGDRGYILSRCGILVLLGLVGLTCSVTAQYFSAAAAIGVATGIRRELFSNILSLSAGQTDTEGTSTLITRLTSDINQVQSGLNLFLRLFLRSPFIVFGSMVMAFTINVRAALIFAAVIPVLSLIVFGVMRWTNPRYKAVQGRLDGVMVALRENLTGVRVVRAFGREQDEVRRFENANSEMTTMQLQVGKISALMNPMTYVVVNIGIIAVLYVGGRQVDGGVLLSGDVYALINYMSQILVELVKLANVIISATKAMACFSRIQAVLDRKPDMVYPETPTGAQKQGEAIRFSHVSLQYAGAGAESLTDIDFAVPCGQTLGVIGGTGSGKSSVVSLMLRFYDATAGQVEMLGRPAAAWPAEQLRGMVGVVPQKARLFTGTIRSNLLWGNENATEQQLWQALETAQAADFVRQKPLGLDEPVEQGGRNFSGGQRQRLTIARALVKMPRVLILDDSASALDFATDAALRRAIAALPGEMTVVIVSQRASSLQHAQQILVLDDGRQVGLGSHSSLLESCPVYREIYESQFKGGEQ